MDPFARKPFNPQRILCPGPCTTTSGPAGVVEEVLWSQIRFSANVHKCSVFVHRFEPYGFGISTPISHNFMIPTIRQCFVAMALFASKNRTFIEPPDFSPEQPRIPPDPFTFASARPTPRRNKNFGQKKRHTRREYRISKHYLRRRHQHCNEFCQLQALNPWIKPQSLRSHLRKPASNRQMPVSCTKLRTWSQGLWRYSHEGPSRLQPFFNDVAFLIRRSSYRIKWGQGLLEPALLLDGQDVETCHDLCTNCHTYCGRCAPKVLENILTSCWKHDDVWRLGNNWSKRMRVFRVHIIKVAMRQTRDRGNDCDAVIK